MSIAWTEDLATGVEEIDAEHRELYRRVASLLASLRRPPVEWRTELTGMLRYLHEYALRHFELEERIMTAAGYPELAAHRALHQDFAERLRDQDARLTGHAFTTSEALEVVDFVGAWLRDHVRRVDGEMGRFLRARPPPAA